VLRAARTRQQEYLSRQFEALDASDKAALQASIPAIEKLLAVKA
jgi:hypothetical protein